MVKCLPEFEYFSVFLKNKNIIFKIRRSKVTEYAALIIGGTQIITNKRKTHLFYKIIHFAMLFSAIVSRFIVKT